MTFGNGMATTGLNPLQRRLRFLWKSGMPPASYNISLSAEIRGLERMDILESAIRSVMAREAGLHFTLHEGEDGVCCLVPARTSDFPFTLWDFSEMPMESACAVMKEELRREVDEPFLPAQPARFRVARWLLPGGTVFLHFTFDHFAVDGWSVDLLWNAIAREFNSQLSGTGIGDRMPPAAGGIQRQGIREPRVRSGEPANATRLDAWKERLRGESHAALTPYRPRPAEFTYKGGTVSLAIPKESSDCMAKFAASRGIPGFCVPLAGFAVLLGHLGGFSDRILGFNFSGRIGIGEKGEIGAKIRTLPIRVRISGEESFIATCETMRDECLWAYENQDIDLEALIRELVKTRDPSRHPLFQVMFSMANAGAAKLRLNGCDVRFGSEKGGFAKSDLSLFLDTSEADWRVDWEYCSDLFERETVEHWAMLHREVIGHLVSNPDGPTRLSAAVHKHRVEKVMGVRTPPSRLRFPTVIHAIADIRRDHPGRIAIEAAGRSFTFSSVWDEAERLAFMLEEAGVVRGDIVALMMPSSAELVVAILGVLKSGAAFLPIDMDEPLERRKLILEDARPNILIHARGRPPSPHPGIRTLEAGFPDGSDAPSVPMRNRAIQIGGSDLAYVMYTSGSTGEPKGVQVEHGALANCLGWMCNQFRLQPNDKVLQKTAYTFDVSLWELIWPLVAGCRIVVADPSRSRDPAYLRSLVRKARVTVAHFVPSMLKIFLEGATHGECPSLRHVLSIGEVLTPELADRFFSLSDSTLYNLYGPTEATIHVTSHECVRGASPAFLPIGKPIDNARVFILSPDLEPVPVGVPGEIVLAGICLARGYLNKPESEGRAFLAKRVFSEEERLYRTGDMGVLTPSGDIVFLGRRDGQIKLRGYRIEIGEIESSMARMPGIRECAVVLESWGVDDERLVGFYASGGTVSPWEFRKWLRANLPSYMIPSHIHELDALPHAPNGKLDKKRLPMATRGPSDREFETPGKSAMEEAILAIWKKHLGNGEFDERWTFFEAGGHSLLSLRVISEISRSIGVEFSVRDLMTMNLRQLAALAGKVGASSP